MPIEEILAITDVEQKIALLKKGRKTDQPDSGKLWADWNPSLHEIMTNKDKYPDRRVLKEEEKTVYDEGIGKSRVIPAKYEIQEVNRITIPLEQDIVNIHTAFTVGTEPTLDCVPNDDAEKKLLSALKAVFRSNKSSTRTRRLFAHGCPSKR